MITTGAALLTACLVFTGCSVSERSAGSAIGAIPTHSPPAEPDRSPVPTTPPVGKVVPLGNAPEGIVVGTSGLGAVAVRDPDGVLLVDATTGAVRQRISTAGAARHLELAGPDGPVLVPLEASNELSQLALSDGRLLSTTTGVGRQPHDAISTSSGTIVVTNELGGGVIFVRNGAVVGSLAAGPVQPGGIAAVGDYAAVADVQGNGVWVYDGTTRVQKTHAAVGVKLTHVVGLGGDLAAFADTDGGAILIERIDPQISQLAKIDAPNRPYGLAYDLTRHRLFVTLTATNVMCVIDLTDPATPRILGDLPTVQQPNSLAVDPRSGAALITGSDPDGASSLQIITADLMPTGAH